MADLDRLTAVDTLSSGSNEAALSRSLNGERNARLIQWGLAVATFVIVIGPILPIVYQSVIDRPIFEAGQSFTFGNYRALLASPGFRDVVLNSLLFAFWSTVISQGLGALLAILIGRTNLPFARLLGAVALWPMFISGLVFAFGWFIGYGPSGYVSLYARTVLGFVPWDLYSIGGMAIVSGVSSIPVTILFCLGAAALADGSLEDAARVCGAKPLRIMATITLPMMLPAIAYSGILNFLGALETLSIPLLLGEPVGIRMFMSFIYAEGIDRPRPNYGIVGTATVILLVIVALLILLQERLLGNTRRYVTVGGKAAQRRKFDLGAYRWLAFAFFLLYAMFAVLVPMGLVVLRGFVSFISPLVPISSLLTFANFREALLQESNVRALWNTLFLSFVGGGLATLTYTFVTLVVHRSDFRFRGALKYVALMPRAVPGMIAGLGIFYAMLVVPFASLISGTIWIIMLAYLSRYVPTGYGVVSPALLQISPELDRAARVMGATWWITCRWILLHLLSPVMLACYAMLFVAFLKEYSTAVFLFAPGTEVLGTSMLRYWANGDIGPMAALSAIQIALTVLFIAVAQLLTGVKLTR